MKKTAGVVFSSLLCTALLFSQSLVEISKKEQERREKLKGTNVRIVTNADLKKPGRKPALSISEAKPSAEASTRPSETPAPAEPSAEAPPEFPETSPAVSEIPNPIFATAVLPETQLVANPGAALNFPDGNYAEISLLGYLDLEFRAVNGPGEDIAVYAKSAGSQDGASPGPEEGIPAGPEEMQWGGSMPYSVFVLGRSGEWEAIGLGTGQSSQEKFDLGNIDTIYRIRILFRYFANPTLGIKPLRIHPEEFIIGIDAVEALH